MKLSPKIIILIAFILFYLPTPTHAAFLIKTTSSHTSNTIIANSNTNNTIAGTGRHSGYTENAVARKKTFFGKIIQKLSGTREVFAAAAAKKKWVAILLGLLDIFVIGGIGLPRFYMGYTPEGIMQLVFYLLGFVGVALVIATFITGSLGLLVPAYLCIGLFVFSYIWQIVDVIRIMCNSLKPKEGYWDK